jgi:hypothetical protein
MLIYRIEHEDSGLGPYQSHVPFYRQHTVQTHPAWMFDTFTPVLPERTNHLLAGFTSEHQLKAWFDRMELVQLHMDGFILKIVEISKAFVHVSPLQCAYEAFMVSDEVTLSIEDLL